MLGTYDQLQFSLVDTLEVHPNLYKIIFEGQKSYVKPAYVLRWRLALC
jgi:hypothetical protein